MASTAAAAGGAAGKGGVTKKVTNRVTKSNQRVTSREIRLESGIGVAKVTLVGYFVKLGNQIRSSFHWGYK